MNNWIKLSQIFQVVLNTEEKAFPVFIHDPKSQMIAALVLVGESIAVSLFNQATTTQTNVTPTT